MAQRILTDVSIEKGKLSVKGKVSKASGSRFDRVIEVLDSDGSNILSAGSNGDIDVGGDIYVGGEGESTFVGDLEVQGAVGLRDDVTIDGSLTAGNITSNGPLVVYGDTTLGNSATDKLNVQGIVKMPVSTDIGTATGANIQDAVSKKHSHGNKAVIDGITSGKVAEWNKINGHTILSDVPENAKFTDTQFSGSYDDLTDKPNASVVNIDDSVAKRHSHANKTVIDGITSADITEWNGINGHQVYKDVPSTAKFTDTVFSKDYNELVNKPAKTPAQIDSAVGKAHTKNTDSGTTSTTFYIGGVAGQKVKSIGAEIQIRNAADNGYADLRVKDLIVEGTKTTINSNEVNIGDNEILLNQDVTNAAQNSGGGVAIKRVKSDNSRADAKIEFDNSTGRWKTAFGNVEAVQNAVIANKLSASIGDGSSKTFSLAHNLGSRDLDVSIREANAPYSKILADIEYTDIDNIQIDFSVAPAANEFRVTILG